MLPRGMLILLGLLPVAVLAVLPLHRLAQTQPTILEVHDLGKGTSQLDGPWQFHAGDDSIMALPQTADATGTNGWEQLTADKPWGAQGHPSYYRLMAGIASTSALRRPQVVRRRFYLLIRHVDDAYEVYWNGRIVGHNGGHAAQAALLLLSTAADCPSRARRATECLHFAFGRRRWPASIRKASAVSIPNRLPATRLTSTPSKQRSTTTGCAAVNTSSGCGPSTGW